MSDRLGQVRKAVASGVLRRRAADAADAHTCAPLILASGTREFAFFLGVSPGQCIAFLAFAFASKHGRFSWRRHRVAVSEDGIVRAVLAVHDGRRTMWDDVHVAWMLINFFGFVCAVRMLLRGLILEGELPAPTREQTLIAHCAVDEAWRGRGVFSALFDDAMRAGGLRQGPVREIVLDVLASNVRARALYERLGFTEMPKSRRRSARLPQELISTRMRFDATEREVSLDSSRIEPTLDGR
ncbi:acetyltransferase [Burkholderia pyrrocinia]|nr:acetyltransferase [Burkholderia pyrrocinia]